MSAGISEGVSAEVSAECGDACGDECGGECGGECGAGGGDHWGKGAHSGLGLACTRTPVCLCDMHAPLHAPFVSSTMFSRRRPSFRSMRSPRRQLAASSSTNTTRIVAKDKAVLGVSTGVWWGEK
jgi:hypothetical protein